MSSLDNLKNRIDYNGGKIAEERMNLSKLRSLKKALLYSYQAQTVELTDGRQFRCLINHDKLKEDYDDKIISIPYKDICLNAEGRKGKTHEGEEEIGMKVGDIFTWVETNTRWLVIQEILEENAYFRATIRKAEDEIVVNGKTYYGYLGRWRHDELWHTKKHTSWSEMGYEVVLYIQKNEDTEGYFHRFQKLWISGKYWEVQFVNDITSDTLLMVYLKEAFINEFADPAENAQPGDQETEPSTEPQEPAVAAIIGLDSVYPFDTLTYTIENATNGTWSLSNTKAKINSQTIDEVSITITSSKTGSIDLIYNIEDEDPIVKTITIKSL